MINKFEKLKELRTYYKCGYCMGLGYRQHKLYPDMPCLQCQSTGIWQYWNITEILYMLAAIYEE